MLCYLITVLNTDASLSLRRYVLRRAGAGGARSACGDQPERGGHADAARRARRAQCALATRRRRCVPRGVVLRRAQLWRHGPGPERGGAGDGGSGSASGSGLCSGSVTDTGRTALKLELFRGLGGFTEVFACEPQHTQHKQGQRDEAYGGGWAGTRRTWISRCPGRWCSTARFSTRTSRKARGGRRGAGLWPEHRAAHAARGHRAHAEGNPAFLRVMLHGLNILCDFSRFCGSWLNTTRGIRARLSRVPFSCS